MLKRFIMIGLLSISGVLALGTSAKALNISGWGLRLGSLFCDMKLKLDKGDPEKMLTRCVVIPTEVDVACEEPEHDDRWSEKYDDRWSEEEEDESSEGRDTFPTLVGEKSIKRDQFRNGKLNVTIRVSTDPLLDHEECEDSYKKPADPIVEEAIVQFAVFECIGGYNKYKSCSRISKKPLDSVIAKCELSEDDYDYDCTELKSHKRKHKNRH